jgi:hypothetical protein
VRVTLWFFADCPNWRLAEQRLRRALAQLSRGDTDLSLEAVETDAEAAAVGFAGSPTFTVDGVGLFYAEAPAGALVCRLYSTRAGLTGVPEVTDLVAALTEKVPS